MPPSAQDLQTYKQVLQATETHVRHAVITGKEKMAKHSAKQTQKKTRTVLKKLGKIT